MGEIVKLSWQFIVYHFYLFFKHYSEKKYNFYSSNISIWHYKICVFKSTMGILKAVTMRLGIQQPSSVGKEQSRIWDVYFICQLIVVSRLGEKSLNINDLYLGFVLNFFTYILIPILYKNSIQTIRRETNHYFNLIFFEMRNSTQQVVLHK